MKNSLIAFIIGLASVAAQASTITVDLSPALVTGGPSNTLQFFGTLTNTTSETVFLNSAEISLAGFDPGSLITDPFFINAPLSLGPSANSGSIELFDIAIPNVFAPSDYVGTFFVFGGVDGSASDNIGQLDFTARVTSGATNPTPEPTAIGLISTGIIFLLTSALHRKRRPVGGAVPSGILAHR